MTQHKTYNNYQFHMHENLEWSQIYEWWVRYPVRAIYAGLNVQLNSKILSLTFHLIYMFLDSARLNRIWNHLRLTFTYTRLLPWIWFFMMIPRKNHGQWLHSVIMARRFASKVGTQVYPWITHFKTRYKPRVAGR
jgi:hypothetical protein